MRDEGGLSVLARDPLPAINRVRVPRVIRSPA